ncbi:MAG: hypothetical protein AB7N61_24130 [Acidimicrobiia bacterium]
MTPAPTPNPAAPTTPVPVVTLVCTANICRSAMAKVLLERELGNRAVVRSAGTWPNDLRPPYEAISLMEQRGLNLVGHRSQVITEEMVRESALLIAMERAHVAHVVSLVPEAFSRTFTLPDLVRRAEAIGRRGPRRPLDEWLRYVHGDRTARQVLSSTGVLGLTGAPSDRNADEIADPYGHSREAFEQCAADLEVLLARFVAVAFPS